jgi:surface antigen
MKTIFKRSLIFFVITVFLLTIFLFIIPTPLYAIECTDYAHQMRTDLPALGDAKYWAVNAAVAPNYFPVNEEPMAGDIVVFQPGDHKSLSNGHVAYVERFNGDGTIYISEKNYPENNPNVNYRIEPVLERDRFIHRKPDLVVTDIKFYKPGTFEEFTPKAGQKVTAYAVLKNNGGYKTVPYNVKWFLDGQEVASGNNSSLEINDFATNNVYYSWQATEGSHNINFVADSNNNVYEPKEDNNNFKKEFSIQKATLLDNILNGLQVVADFFTSIFNPPIVLSANESQQSIAASIESAKVATETTAPIPPPAKPSLVSPYNWYQSLGVPPNLMWNGDNNSSSYYVVVNSSNTGNIESGWINSKSWKPNLPNQNYIYTWKVKAKNSQGKEGPWSDESHFSIASTSLKFEGDISFSPPSPSSANQIKIFASTTGWGGVGITLRVSVNTSPDGSSNGEWKILKELGVPKFNENDAPIWETKGWQNGTYRVRVEAKGPNDPYWQNPAIIETTYTLVNKPIETVQSYEESNINIDPGSLLLNEDFSSGNLNFWNTVGDVTIYSDGGNLVAKCISTDKQYTDMYYHFYIQSSTNQQIMINSIKTLNFSCRIKAVDFSSGEISVYAAFISDTGESVGGISQRFSPGELPIGSWKTLTFKENLSGYPDFDLIILGVGSYSLNSNLVYFDDFRIY